MYGSKLHLVPVGEMVDCLRVKAKEVEIKVGMWVRVKRGKYGGDLGQVLDVPESGENALVKLIPRLDYSRDSMSKRKKADLKHPQKLFNINDVRYGRHTHSSKREVQQVQGGYTYQGEIFDREGYMEKTMKLSSIDYKNVNPTLEEITKFSAGAIVENSEDLSLLASSNVAKAEDFQNGEKVIALSGQNKGMEGVVQSIENGIVTVLPDKNYGLKTTVQYNPAELAKRFVEGDHVKVVNGVHKEKSGLVLTISNNVVTILSDSDTQTFDVFTKDLRQAIDVTSITPSTSQFDVHDLVQLSPNELGVVIKVEKDTITLLDPFGSVIKVKPQQIRSRRDSGRAVTSDMNNRPITAKDPVMVMDEHGGPNRRQGTVLHVYRSFVFVHSRDVAENGGVFVAKNTNVVLVSAKGANANNPNSAFNQQPRMISSPGRTGRNFRDPLLNKTVTISGGPFKGYLGIVKDTTETHARVELHTNSRTITIEKERLNVQGEEGAPKRPNYQAGRPTSRYDDYGRTPANSGSKTPYDSWSGGTGGRTPAWNAGSKTPAWEAGSKTPAWEAGSKTPAWEAGSKTPAWEAGSKTPAWESGRTPAYGRPTPRVPNTPADMATPYHTATPAGFPQTPGLAATTPYPNMQSVAHTPATPYETPYHGGPATPAATGSYGSSQGAWVTADIEVRVESNRRFSSGRVDGQVGVVKAVEGIRAQIYLASGETIHITEELLVPVVPQKKDAFKVLKGEDRGKIGTLLSIDGHEGVVKLEGVDDILMMNLDTLAKLAN
ncbi:transcription elongation factor spt5 [Kappamyces sp. JEL0680]|nr:transcription elongation factor spt5 [Kappamyces sp. JEL0680]